MKKLLLIRTKQGKYTRYVLAANEPHDQLIPFDTYFMGCEFTDNQNTWLAFRFLKEHLDDYVKEMESGCH